VLGSYVAALEGAQQSRFEKWPNELDGSQWFAVVRMQMHALVQLNTVV